MVMITTLLPSLHYLNPSPEGNWWLGGEMVHKVEEDHSLPSLRETRGVVYLFFGQT